MLGRKQAQGAGVGVQLPSGASMALMSIRIVAESKHDSSGAA
jgi:hypothetical protein